jgi:hypothetical protein
VLAALAGLGAAWYAALPPAARPLPAAPEGLTRPPRGAMHVHTDRSDGTGTVEEVAAAAARAGLDFLILTDHGDGTREPDEPRYLEGVLCIDAVEISTDGGHLVVLGLPAAPYPLAGEARDVVEDVLRLGGFPIAAHPGSGRPALRWQDWTLPVGGLEWLNGDSEWRDERAWSLARALFTYPVRRTETLVSLLDRPAAVLERWDALTAERQVVALAAADAHARIGVRSLGESYDSTASIRSASIRVPAYERVFRALSISLPETTLTGDAAVDGPAVLAAIRRGHVYSTIDGLGGPAAMSFTATSGTARAAAGDVLPLGDGAALRVDVQAPPDARIDLWKDGSVLASGAGPGLEHAAGEAGVYRVEVSLPGAPGEPPVPWIVSNPIYVGRTFRAEPPQAPGIPVSATTILYDDGPAAAWTIERSEASLGALDVVPSVGGTQLSFRWALGGTMSSSPYVALVAPAGGEIEAYERLVFTARAARPTRMSVQLRAPGGELGERWHRSVVLGEEPREVSIAFDDLRPRGGTTRRDPALADVDSVLFVVDTVNTENGRNGQIWIDEVRYVR